MGGVPVRMWRRGGDEAERGSGARGSIAASSPTARGWEFVRVVLR